MAKAVDGLQTFKDLDLKDLRNLDVDERNELVDEIDAGSSLDEALALLEVHMGFSAEYMSEIVKTTPIGDIHILRGYDQLQPNLHTYSYLPYLFHLRNVECHRFRSQPYRHQALAKENPSDD